jgi:hypothetical protein
MTNRPRLAGLNTGQGGPVGDGLTWATVIFELFPFRVLDGRHRILPKRIVGILLPNLKKPAWAGRQAIPATVAPVRIDADKKITGAVLIAVLGDHSNLPLPGVKVMEVG